MDKRGKNKFLIRDKKGIEMVWTTVIVAIIALFLLAFLVAFFLSGSSSFVEKVKGYFTYSNVDTVISNCNLLSAGQEYAFCCEKKKVKYYLDGKRKEEEFTCSELVDKAFINNKINDLNCGGVVC